MYVYFMYIAHILFFRLPFCVKVIFFRLLFYANVSASSCHFIESQDIRLSFTHKLTRTLSLKLSK